MEYMNTHVVNKQGIRIDYRCGIKGSLTITQHWWPSTKQAQLSDLKPLEFSLFAQEYIVAIWHIKPKQLTKP